MAATNFTPIILYHSVTASAAPTAGNLNNGELAINITDGKLFYKDNGGVVQIIATKGTGVIGGSNNQVQYNSSGALAGSANFTFDGTTATINTLNLTTVLDETYGGTGLTSYTTGDVIYASGSNTLAKLAIGANTYILTSTGSVPQWSAPSAVSVSTATNLAGGTAGAVPYQSGVGATTFLSIGTSNQVLTSTGSAPQWVSGLSLTTLSTSGNTTLGDAAADNLTINATVTSNLIFTDNTYDIGANGATRPRTIYVGTSVFSPLVDTTNLEVTNIKALDGTAALSIAGSTGAVTVATALTANGGAVFNENGANVDFRVEGDTDANLFFVDASADAVGIGTNAPLGKVHSFSSSSGASPSSNGNQLVLESSGNAGLTIATGASSLGNIFFADSGDNADGYIQYDQSGRSLRFGTATAEKLRITSGGQVNIGGNFTSTNNTLQVTGNAAIGDTLAGPTDGLYVKGNVGIGTNSPAAKLQSSAADGSIIFGASGTTKGLRIVTDSTSAVIQGIDSTLAASYQPLTITGTELYFRSGSGTPSEKMRLDSSGNLGLGVTPSAYNNRGFDISSFVGLSQNSAGAATLAFNNFQNSAGNYIYKTTNAAARYDCGNEGSGRHAWFTAASGTANTTTITNGVSYTIITSGNQTAFGAANNNVGTSFTANASGTLSSGTVSQNISFTQAMTLDASGNLGIGQTNPSTWLVNGLGIGSGANDWGATIYTGTASTGYLCFADGATGLDRYRGYISYAHATNAMIFATDAAERARITSAGMRVGLFNGVGNSTWYGYSAVTNDLGGSTGNVGLYLDAPYNAGTTNTGFFRTKRGASDTYNGTEIGVTSVFRILTSTTEDTNERVRVGNSEMVVNEPGNDYDFRVESDTDTHCLFVDASTDRVGIGTNAPGVKLDIANASSFTGLRLIRTNNSSQLTFTVQSSTAIIESTGTGSNALAFNTEGTERARITSGGYFKASNTGSYLSSTGTYHELRTTTDNAEALYVSSASTNGTQYGMVIRTANDQNDATRYFLQSEGGGTIRATIRSNGGLANYSANDVNLASDLRLKNTIEPMRSYYDVFKNINWVTWLYNDQTDDLKNHGVIAQELQELAPEFVCESNAKEAPEGEAPYLGIWEQDFKMAGMSVITELIKKIEKLEAEVAALKGV